MIPSLRRLFLSLLLFVATPLVAVDVPVTDDPWRAKTIALAPLDPQYDAAAVASYLASPGWQGWNRARGGNWTAQLDTLTGVPRRVWGGAIPWISGPANDLENVPPAELERVARAFIDANRSLFGAGNDRLQYVAETASPAASGRMHYATFQAVVNGVPVDHGRLVFAVNGGNLIYWHSTNIADVPAVTTPLVSAASAVNAVLAHAAADAAGVTVVQAPSLRLVPRNTGGGGPLAYRLAYELAVRRTAGEAVWGALVDALTGAVLAFGDDTRHLSCPETRTSSPGQVDGGVRRALATDAEVVRPLPSLVVTTGGADAVSDANGAFRFFGGTASSALAGSFVRIECADCVKSVDDPQGGFQPFASSFGSGRLSFGSGGGDVMQGGGLPTISYGNGTSTPAARSAFYNVNAAHALARKWLSLPWLSTRMDVRVNFNAACNARWDGTRLTYYKAGTANGLLCANSGEIRDVVQHEWAHALDDFDGRRPGYALGHGDMATGEGMADLLAFFGDHDACLGHSLFPDPNGPSAGLFVAPGGTAVSRCSGVRNIDEHRGSRGLLTVSNVQQKCPAAVVRNTSDGLLPNEVLTGPLLRQAHCEGEIYGQTGYHLAQNLLTGRRYGTVVLDAGRQFATYAGDPIPDGPGGSPNPALDAESAWTIHERMFYESKPLVGSYAPSRYQAIGPSAYDSYLIVDDEGDGLANGTPHAAYVNDAFVHHGIEEWSTPGTPAVPDAANCAPLATPQVQVAASIDTESGLPAALVTWSGVPGATRYTVLRSEHHHEPFLPIATLGADARSAREVGLQNGMTYLYRVEAAEASACDRRSPAGVTALTVALGDPRVRFVTITDTPTGNNDGALDPGERAQLFPGLGNEGLAGLTNVTVHLQAITPGVTVRTAGAREYGAVPAGGAAGPNMPFVITLDSSRALCGIAAELRLAISSDQGCFTETLVLPVGSDAAGCNVNHEVALHSTAALTDDRLGAGCGDGDGIADPGETVAVTVAVMNAGEKTANDVAVALTTEEPYLTITGPASVFVGSVEGSNRMTKLATFDVQVGSGAPVDGLAGLTITITAANAPAPATEVVSIRVNRDTVVVDREYGFESGDEGWTSSDPVNGWQRAAGPSAAGTLSTVWHSQYRSSQCDVLLSPVWELDANASVSFSLAYTTEEGFDGVDVQVTVDGGATWHTVHPTSGYPFLASAGGCIPANSPLFSGASPVAEVFTIDLAELAGTTAQLRFRMSSDSLIEPGAGAWLDAVVVRGVRAIAPSAPCGGGS